MRDAKICVPFLLSAGQKSFSTPKYPVNYGIKKYNESGLSNEEETDADH